MSDHLSWLRLTKSGGRDPESAMALIHSWEEPNPDTVAECWCTTERLSLGPASSNLRRFCPGAEHTQSSPSCSDLWCLSTALLLLRFLAYVSPNSLGLCTGPIHYTALAHWPIITLSFRRNSRQNPQIWRMPVVVCTFLCSIIDH